MFNVSFYATKHWLLMLLAMLKKIEKRNGKKKTFNFSVFISFLDNFYAKLIQNSTFLGIFRGKLYFWFHFNRNCESSFEPKKINEDVLIFTHRFDVSGQQPSNHPINQSNQFPKHWKVLWTWNQTKFDKRNIKQSLTVDIDTAAKQLMNAWQSRIEQRLEEGRKNAVGFWFHFIPTKQSFINLLTQSWRKTKEFFPVTI